MSDNPTALNKNRNSRSSIIEDADKLINGDRSQDYGPVEKNFERIGKGWGVILGCDVPAWKVALCMDWLKTARLVNDPTKRDSWVDKAGYSALGGEIAMTEDD